MSPQIIKLNSILLNRQNRKGLAHAIYLGRETFSTEPMLIILGDTIFDVNLKPMLKAVNILRLVLKKLKTRGRFGVVEVGMNLFAKLIEKPENPNEQSCFVGLYWIRIRPFSIECIEELFKNNKKTKGEYQLTDALQLMVQHGEKVKTVQRRGMVRLR